MTSPSSTRRPLPLGPILLGLALVIVGLLVTIGVLLALRADDANPSPRSSPGPSAARPLATPTPPLAPKPADFRERARTLLERGEHAALVVYVGPYAERDDPVALGYLGLARMAQGKTEEAVRALTRSAELGAGEAATALALHYRNLREFEACARWAKRAAELEEPAGLRVLGDVTFRGAGVRRDEARGLDYLRQAAVEDDRIAMRLLGLIYSEGKGGVQRDVARGLRWYQQAADAGDAYSCRTLGHLLVFKEGATSADYARARELLQRASVGGSKRALALLGWTTFHGLGVPRDEKEGFQTLQQLADQELPEALYLLGKLHWDGAGSLEAAPKVAIPLFQRAAERGSADAMHRLGMAYEEGRGVAVDARRAIDYYEQAVDQGHQAGLVSLAIHLIQGRFVEQDFPRAARLLQQGADNGDARGALVLAGLLSGGDELPNDYPRARALYLQAAEAGNLDAIAHAARILDRGVGGARDRREALRWATLGAERGHARSMFMLGTLLYEGRPELSPERREEGKTWLLKAAAAEDRLALDYVRQRGLR